MRAVNKIPSLEFTLRCVVVDLWLQGGRAISQSSQQMRTGYSHERDLIRGVETQINLEDEPQEPLPRYEDVEQKRYIQDKKR
jgi:hypothetical protein